MRLEDVKPEKLIVHIGTPIKINDTWLTVYADELKMAGLPRCSFCNRRLRKGSYVDHLYPYHTENSFHAKCYRSHK